MGISIWNPPARVTTLIFNALPYTLALIVPATVLSYMVGNRLGAAAARRKALDNTVLPLGYIAQAIPYPFLALLVPYLLGVVWHIFPTRLGYGHGLLPAWNWAFIGSHLDHRLLPFLTLFLVNLGGSTMSVANLAGLQRVT